MPYSSSVNKLFRETHGNVAITFAIVLPFLFMLVGGGVDYAYVVSQKNRLQIAADAAAISVAKQSHVLTFKPEHAQSIAEAFVKAQLDGKAKSYSVTATVNSDPVRANITISQKTDAFFLKDNFPKEIKVSSTAQLMGGVPLCVLALNETSSGAISLQEKARMTGNRCAVYSNSSSSSGIVSRSGATLAGHLICSTGGTKGGETNFQPAALTDCPEMPDPLIDRSPPQIGGCDYQNYKAGVSADFKTSRLGNAISLGVEFLDDLRTKENATEPTNTQNQNTNQSNFITIEPGVYCGGLIVGGNAYVKLRPGTYIIKDGPLHITDTATIEGEHVGFYLTGNTNSVFFFGANTSVSLTAPKDGPMAGLLFYEDRNSSNMRQFTILSDNARILVGTIYLPKGWLFIDADKPIADLSAYTAIISNRISLFAGPHLVLNTDYGATDVPVPEGVKNLGAEARLVK